MHAVIRALRRAVAVCRDVSDDLALPLPKLAPAQPAASPLQRQGPRDTHAAITHVLAVALIKLGWAAVLFTYAPCICLLVNAVITMQVTETAHATA